MLLVSSPCAVSIFVFRQAVFGSIKIGRSISARTTFSPIAIYLWSDADSYGRHPLFISADRATPRFPHGAKQSAEEAR